jgi:hypothetical protein
MSRWTKQDIGYLYSVDTKGYSGCSTYDTRTHIHAAVCSEDLSPVGIGEKWTMTFGNCQIGPFDFSQDGIGYILKLKYDDRCDWGFSRNFYLWADGYKGKDKYERNKIEECRNRGQLLASNPPLFNFYSLRQTGPMDNLAGYKSPSLM